MAKSALQKHIHKVKRQRFKSGNHMYFCTLPDCYWKINPALFLGKTTICWRCGEEFNMNEYSLRLARPHCEKCHKTKSEDKEEATINALSQAHRDITQSGVSMAPIAESLSLADKLTSLLKKQASNTIATEGDEDI